MHIAFIQAGGTIDKAYPATETHHGYNFEIDAPAFERILKRVRWTHDSTYVTALRKDSLDMTETDRQRLKEVVKQQPGSHIIITHGTDRINESAQVLKTITDKTIVLTGAVLPELFYESDATFNLGMAVAAVQVLPPGVYVALDGAVSERIE